MEVTIECHLNPRYPKMVYATIITIEGVTLVSASLDYCVFTAKAREYKIVNAQEVLEWVFGNVEVRALNY